jgi:hypothetical protein
MTMQSTIVLKIQYRTEILKWLAGEHGGMGHGL